MARRRRSRGPREDPGPSGFLVVDKPSGCTSHDIVDAARKWLGTRRVGHLGTLDPAAKLRYIGSATRTSPHVRTHGHAAVCRLLLDRAGLRPRARGGADTTGVYPEDV